MSTDLVPQNIDHAAVLRTLNLNPTDPKTQALLLVCDKYGLDPLLKHMVLIQGTPYVTRDGYLHLAHQSGKFDGLEVLEEGETGSHWVAKVAVHRKDMSHPFTYTGRYPKGGGNKAHGPEMAIKCAEVMALRRAFNVTGVGAVDERWDAQSVDAETGEIVAAGTEEVRTPPPAPALPAAAPTATVRRPPPAKPGYVTAAKAKQTLVDFFLGERMSDVDAKAAAKAAWGSRGSQPIMEKHLDDLLASLGAVPEVELAPDPLGEEPAPEQPSLEDDGRPFE